jgi:hypothetical protein
MKNKKLYVLIAIASIIMATTSFAQVYPEGMISYWKFDDESGITAFDSVSSNHGAIESPTWTTGQVGGALQFNGYDHVTVPDDTSLKPSNITIEGWYFPTSYGYYRSMVTKPYYGSSWGNPWTSYSLMPLPWNTQRAAVFAAVDGIRYYAQTPEDVLTPIGEWSHVVGTYDGQTLRIYLNGELKALHTGVSGQIDSTHSTSPLYIGDVPGTNNRFYGKIDEVAIYNRAITPEEIQLNYENGLVGLGYEISELACNGFEPPMVGAVTVKKNRVLPLKTQLFDGNGSPITDADNPAPPVLQVLFSSNSTEDVIDVTDEALSAGHGTDGNQFVFTEDDKWQFNLKTKNYTSPGTYTVQMVSGDGIRYVIEPTCEATFVIK